MPGVRQSIPRITIIGLGLIGGSIGLALMKAFGDRVVVCGYDQDPTTLVSAHARSAVHEPLDDLNAAVEQANLVIIATPVFSIRDIFVKIAPILPPGTIVTDTGSTKKIVMQWAQEIFSEKTPFIGGHPMAGREASGILSADASLFIDSVYCITSTANENNQAEQVVSSLALAIGAAPLLIEATLHDFYTAGVSHLPILLSTLLMTTLANDQNWPEMALLAATGFRDVSRLASGNVSMHRDISLSNIDPITHWLDKFRSELDNLVKLLAKPSMESDFVDLLAKSRETREQWLSTWKTTQKAQTKRNHLQLPDLLVQFSQQNS